MLHVSLNFYCVMYDFEISTDRQKFSSPNSQVNEDFTACTSFILLPIPFPHSAPSNKFHLRVSFLGSRLNNFFKVNVCTPRADLIGKVNEGQNDMNVHVVILR